eukprot:CAMPEP_0168392188 /NCGR_PEP_ID=MMETSP0228-20121227/18371_1 /TAXON_ID=133427 /ORGANISM="Protoceratium reticulatum, Strain CCCM 535 (=CCMP 1889)" /LENGTH=322 /DNA_ID=CAMNT_0008405525 /DNA_START=68 /DNA_END=1034 /DNA_ORIENTATION=+
MSGAAVQQTTSGPHAASVSTRPWMTAVDERTQPTAMPAATYFLPAQTSVKAPAAYQVPMTAVPTALAAAPVPTDRAAAAPPTWTVASAPSTYEAPRSAAPAGQAPAPTLAEAPAVAPAATAPALTGPAGTAPELPASFMGPPVVSFARSPEAAPYMIVHQPVTISAEEFAKLAGTTPAAETQATTASQTAMAAAHTAGTSEAPAAGGGDQTQAAVPAGAAVVEQPTAGPAVAPKSKPKKPAAEGRAVVEQHRPQDARALLHTGSGGTSATTGSCNPPGLATETASAQEAPVGSHTAHCTGKRGAAQDCPRQAVRMAGSVPPV